MAACLRFEERERLFVDFGEMPEFHEVDPTFSGFGFGNEGLWPRHEPRNLQLRQASGLPSLLEPRPKKLIFANVGIGLQCEPRMATRSACTGVRVRIPKSDIANCSMQRVEWRLIPQPVISIGPSSLVSEL
jgi:hypothetical protein